MSSDIVSRQVTVDDACVSNVHVPATIDELREVVARCLQARQRALIVGGGTRLSFGNLGGPFDVAISTAGLNRVIRYEPDDLTLAVEPGCTIAQLDALLAAHGQQVALDVALPGQATIGGSYATGLSGPRRLGGGSLKDWVIGVEVVGPDGAIGKAGGMVVKNVTGYDMMHVHCGALGAFGIVTRLNLKVFPRPGAERSVCIRYATPADAYAAGIAVLRSQLQPSSILISNDNGWSLAVRCDAPPGAIERVAQRVIDTALAERRPQEIVVSEDGADATASFVAIMNLRAGAAVARLSVPASGQLAALARLTSYPGWRMCADLGSGLLYVAAEPGTTWPEQVRAVEQRATFLALPASMKRDLDVFGPLEDAGALVVRRLKEAFDPNGQFNRGRFVLGL